MCGFVGFANLKEKIIQDKMILENMNQTLKKRGPDEDGYYIGNYVAMGHKRLIVIDPEGGKQPMLGNNSYGDFVLSIIQKN